MVFGDKLKSSFKNVPIFSNEELKLEEALKLNCLNADGVTALKRILWCLKKLFMNIEYNPQIVQTAALMLIFLSEGETYCILKYIMVDSQHLLKEDKQGNDNEQQRRLRWHFMMNQVEFFKLKKSFIETIRKKSKTFDEILKHFIQIGFEYMDFFDDLLNNIFIEYLSFSAIIKIFIMFMNEGIKIYFRMMYAICRVQSDKILQIKDPSTMKNFIRKNALNLTYQQIYQMIRVSALSGDLSLRLPLWFCLSITKTRWEAFGKRPVCSSILPLQLS